MALSPTVSFYRTHPAFATRAEKDSLFDQFVNNNIVPIQFVLEKTRALVLSLKQSHHEQIGMRTLHGPVSTIISIPYSISIPNQPSTRFFVAHLNDSKRSPFSNKEDYTKRVQELAEKIEQSLDKLLSKLSCNELDTHIKLADQGMLICFLSPSANSSTSRKYFNASTDEPDEVRIKISTSDAP
jgi:hypothetical protein